MLTLLMLATYASVNLSASIDASIENGDFSNGLAGWHNSGPIAIVGASANPAALLDEDEELLDGTNLHQEFQVPLGFRRALQFTFTVYADESAVVDTFIPDAFLVSLLDPASLEPLLHTAGFTDFFAVEFIDPALRFFVDYDASLVTLPHGLVDATVDGSYGIIGTVVLNLDQIPPGTPARIDFTLAGGFDGWHTSVIVDSVSATGLECLEDFHCSDGNECTIDTCVEGSCVFPPVPRGTFCGWFGDVKGKGIEGPCDQFDICDGKGRCDPNYLPATYMCRSSTTDCDQPEFCTGRGPDCPDNVHAPDGTPCKEDGQECTVDECRGGSCTHPNKLAGEPCGNPIPEGTCDNPDSCNGFGQCDPSYSGANTLCRAAISDCDIAEFCSNTGPVCPDDQRQANGFPCEDDGLPNTTDICMTGVCTHQPHTTNPLCGDGIIQQGEECEVGIPCFQVLEKPCKETICDDACQCVKRNLPTGTIVSTDEDCMDLLCSNGMSFEHPKPSGAPCGVLVSQGPCDLPDTCNGWGGCDWNRRDAYFVCRPALDACDKPEYCSGVSAACPPDVCASAGTPAADDESECTYDVCDGDCNSIHPPKARGLPCGDPKAEGPCDLPDQCDGHGVCDSNTTLDGQACEFARTMKFEQCLSGPSNAYPDPSCFSVDLDEDGDVDLSDCSFLIDH